MNKKLERHIKRFELEQNGLKRKQSFENIFKLTEFLSSNIEPANTFKFLRNNIENIFGNYKDKNGRLLMDYGLPELQKFINRVEEIAIKFKEKFSNTALCQREDEEQNSSKEYSDELLEEIKLFIFYEISPIVGKFRGYPAWDKISGQSQEINFFNKPMVHILYTQVLADQFLDRINAYIENANENNINLEEKSFGYLKTENGKYRKIDKNVFKARLLLHDLGRWVSHHTVLHEIIPEWIFHYAGLDHKMSEHIFSHEEYYFSDNPDDIKPENIPFEAALFHFIDFISKRNDEDNFEDKNIRSLDKLAEHTIARASNYNGDLKEYLERIKHKKYKRVTVAFLGKKLELLVKNKTKEITVKEKIKIALDILRNSKNSHQAQFYERELAFLELIVPYLDKILLTVGTNLELVIKKTEEEINYIEDKALFVIPSEKGKPTSSAKKLFISIKNQLNKIPYLYTRRFKTVGIKR